MTWGRRKKKGDFQFIVDKVHEKILAWSSFWLSQPIKMILIQSILLSISSHFMWCLMLLVYVTNKIDSLFTRVFWASKGEKGMHWVGREIIQRPKKEGGFGDPGCIAFE